MGSLPEAFYTPTDDGYEATALTQGPWAAGFQHGGPPAALLAGAMASYGDNADTRLLVRTTVELLRPVPIGVVKVDIEPVRGGRRVDWVRATMRCEGECVAVATGMRIALAPLRVPEPHCEPRPTPPPPNDAPTLPFPYPHPVGYFQGVEVRHVEGTWNAAGPVAIWARPRVPLVAGRRTSCVESVALIADAQNGICTALPALEYIFVNADLNVRLFRPFEGEWIGLRARAQGHACGIGMNQGSLFDASGEVGSVEQSLALATR
ncbi:MAG: thioesterase family protein [Nannocystales bacterium]